MLRLEALGLGTPCCWSSRVRGLNWEDNMSSISADSTVHLNPKMNTAITAISIRVWYSWHLDFAICMSTFAVELF